MVSVHTWMRGALAAAGVFAAIAASPGSANAALSGTVAIGSLGFIPPAGDALLSAITVSPLDETYGLGTGDFSGFVGGSVSDSGFDITSLASLLGYAFTSSNGDFFSVHTAVFTAPHTAHQLDAELIGTFTNGAGSAPAALLVTFGQVGGPGTTISYGSTLTTSIPPVPEPISLAVIGTGLVGLGLARRRKA